MSQYKPSLFTPAPPVITDTVTEAEYQAFAHALNILRFLRGPSGCPWDKRQTLESLRANMLEEPAELIEAIHLLENAQNTNHALMRKARNHTREEFGDVFLVWAMMMIIYEEEEPHGLANTLEELAQKLVRRHPHVFNTAGTADTSDNALSKQWEDIKTKQEGKRHTISHIHEFHPSLDVLERTKKLQKQLEKQSNTGDERSGKVEKQQRAINAIVKLIQGFQAHNTSAKNEVDTTNPQTTNKQLKDKPDVQTESFIANMLYQVVALSRAYGISPTAALMRLNTEKMPKESQE